MKPAAFGGPDKLPSHPLIEATCGNRRRQRGRRPSVDLGGVDEGTAAEVGGSAGRQKATG